MVEGVVLVEVVMVVATLGAVGPLVLYFEFASKMPFLV